MAHLTFVTNLARSRVRTERIDVAAAVAAGDGELLELWYQVEAAHASLLSLCQKEAEAVALREDHPELYHRWDQMCDRMSMLVSRIERRIAATPARSFAGVAVKLRVYMAQRGSITEPSAPDVALLSACADAERLAATSAQPGGDAREV
jgi:hypothetical protein